MEATAEATVAVTVAVARSDTRLDTRLDTRSGIAVEAAVEDIHREVFLADTQVEVAAFFVVTRTEAATSLDIPEDSDRTAAHIEEPTKDMSDVTGIAGVAGIAGGSSGTQTPAQLFGAGTTIPSGTVDILARWGGGMAHPAVTLRLGREDILQTGQVDCHTARLGDMAVGHTALDQWAGTVSRAGTVPWAGTAG